MNKMNKKEKLNALIKKQQAIVDKAKVENGRSLNEDEQRSFDGLQSQIDELKRDIEPDGAERRRFSKKSCSRRRKTEMH